MSKSNLLNSTFGLLVALGLDRMGYPARPNPKASLYLEDYEIVPRHPKPVWVRDWHHLELFAKCGTPEGEDCRQISDENRGKLQSNIDLLSGPG